MRSQRSIRLILVAAVAAGLVFAAGYGVRSQHKPDFVINLTSGTQDLHSVWMGLSLASMAIEEGRSVTIFCNVRAPILGSRKLNHNIAFKGNTPIRAQMESLIKAGATVMVCPLCAKELGIKETDLLPGVKMATKPSLFGRLGADSVVFSY